MAFLNGWTPALAWVVFRNRAALACGLFAQILLVNDAILSDKERHDARVPVVHRVGQNGESASHFSVHDVVFRATLCIGALLREYPVVVAVEWLRFVARVGVAQRLCEVTKGTKGTRRPAFCNGPVQPVLFALVAREPLGVLFNFAEVL